jgi:hypothetical protein
VGDVPLTSEARITGGESTAAYGAATNRRTA